MNHPTSRLAPLWQPTFLVWAFFSGECLALAMSLAPGVEGDRAVWFGLNSMVVQWIIAISLLVTRLLRNWLENCSVRGIARACLAILVASTAITLTLFWAFLPQSLRPTHDAPGFLLASACVLALLYGLMAVGMLENHLRLRQLAIQSTRAQLVALQARVRPHFLFNTLNSAVSLAGTDPAKAETLLMDLSDLFRVALSEAPAIGLQQELEICQRYLAIEKARFGERLALEWNLDGLPTSLQLPPLCLQSLLENAVHHGVERSAGTTTIKVSTGQPTAEGMACICVENPTVAAVQTKTPHRGHGAGLEGIRARLAAFDTRARLDTRQMDGHFIARLHLPIDQVTTR